MALPKGLTREHIEQAIAQLDTGAPHSFGASTDYDVLVNGKAYPPKAVVGLAASLATGTPVGPSDFSAGEGPGQANAVLRSLGFTVERRTPDAPTVAPTTNASADGQQDARVTFAVSDCEIFTRNRSGSPWNDVGPADQEQFKDIRLRLKTLAQQLTPIAANVSVPVSSVASQTAPNGRVPREMWSCVFPNTVSNKSFALQFAVIINGAGSEVCCCLGAGTSQETDAATLAQLQQMWTALKTALASVPDDIQQEFEQRLGDRWQLRRSWLEEPGQIDFSTFKEWLAYASSDQGAGASISRNLTPEELQFEGDRFFDQLAVDVETFAPLFRHVYGGMQPSPSRNLSSVPPQPSLHPRLWQEFTDLRTQLMARGELPSLEALRGYYETFRRRFGPDVLAATDGEALLSLMHETTKDGLVYWLEFKDDDELPAIFGSIAGGSALNLVSTAAEKQGPG